MSWFEGVQNVNSEKEFTVQKAINPNLIKEEDLLKAGFIIVATDGCLEKAERDTSKLTKKEIWVTRGGKSFKQTVYVKTGEEEKKVEPPIGEEVTPTVKGMNVVKYSDKSLLITGDTYVNKETLREIKSEVKAGVWNRKLNGWVFPSKFLDTILGYLYSDQKENGNDEKAEAIKNQKNAGLESGDTANVGGIDINIEENVSTNEGTKYKATLDDGTKLDGVDEKVIDKEPQANDKKIAEATNNASAESRVATAKKIYGIQPIEDIHNYSLSEYMGLHGISQEDIDRIVGGLKKAKSGNSKKSSGGSSKTYTKKDQKDGLTKQQLIRKLVYAHYQAVKKAIDNGDEVKESVLDTYEDLATLYKTKRKEMTEETKRKISEALKKNGVEESDEFIKERALLEKLETDVEKNQKEYYRLFDVARAMSSDIDSEKDGAVRAEKYSKQQDVKEQARSFGKKADSGRKGLQQQKNIVQCLENGGELVSVTDKVGDTYEKVPSFTKINTSDIEYDIDNILTKEKPPYIPEINEADFKNGSYIFDVVKSGEDKYLLATNKYKESVDEYDKSQAGFVEVTLDQLVLTQDYYVTKQKAKFKEVAAERNKRQEENWDKKEDKTKEYYLMQRGIYRSLPAKTKKQIPETKWDSMSWQEREKHYKPIKKYGVERIKSNFDSKHMASSFHSMYERFVNPEALRQNSKKQPLKRGERSFGTSYASPEVFQSWLDFKQTLDFKINDINIQREELSGIRNKAIETSYGMSNTNDSLLEGKGILVKRQNGDDILPKEIEQLDKAWTNVQETFGTLKENAKADNLKLSHAGKTYMFASKAIGVYVPSMKTIGVTAKYGENQLGFTMAHEVAHWIDGTLGAKVGKRHLSDNYESTAGQIATLFRKNMNKPSKSNYINATHECLARAFEFHHAVESMGKDVVLPNNKKYAESDEYVSLETYNTTIKPLIEKFFEENKEFLKSDLFDLLK